MSASPDKTLSPDFSFFPLWWISVCFAAGILAASRLTAGYETYLTIVFINAVAAAAFVNRKPAAYFVLIAAAASGAFYFQITKSSEPSNSVKSLIESGRLKSGDPVELEGVLSGNPELSVGGFYITLSAKTISDHHGTSTVSGRVRFFAPAQKDETKQAYAELELNHGAGVRINSRIFREQRYHNPGTVSAVELIDQKGIDAVSTIKSPFLIERLDDTAVFLPLAWIYDYRQSMIEQIKSGFNISTAGILIASMLGNRHYLTRQTSDLFRHGGTFHILVISGLHITLIGGVLILVAGRLTKNRLLQFVSAVLPLWLYSIAVGAGIPVVRAALMSTILLFSFVVHRRGSLLNALGSSAIVILLWRPDDLFNQSFHLSFSSLTGLFAAAIPLIERLRMIGMWSPSREFPLPPCVPAGLKVFCELIYWSEQDWNRRLRRTIWKCGIAKSTLAGRLEKTGLQKPVRWVFEGIVVTTVVQIFMCPFLIVYFHRISPGSIVLNLWVTVFIILQNTAALASLVLSALSGELGAALVRIAESLNWLLLLAPKIFAAFDLGSIRVPVYNYKVVYVFYLIPVLMLTILLNNWKPVPRETKQYGATRGKSARFRRRLAISGSILLILVSATVIFHPLSSPAADGKLTVVFLDVGQGDAALITFPNGKTMLVDGGGKQNFANLKIVRHNGDSEPFDPDTRLIGEAVVSEYLWERGFSSLDFVLSTHADADHIEGLKTVIRNFTVTAALIGAAATEDQGYDQFIELSSEKRLEILGINGGQRIEIGGVIMEVLSPAADDQLKQGSSNNRSVVFRLIFGSKKILFTGDIEMDTENELVKSPAYLEADVVKVAHHGSRTSSSQGFINAAKAQYAIIPVGRTSPFGHPHSEVVRRWENAGAKVMTTGRRGAITISTDGKNLEVQTHRQN